MKVFYVLSDRQIVFFLVGDSLVKDTGKYFAEQSCNYKNQDNNKNSRCHINEQTAAGDQCDQKAVEANDNGYQNSCQNSGKEHEVQKSFGKYSQFVFYKSLRTYL